MLLIFPPSLDEMVGSTEPLVGEFAKDFPVLEHGFTWQAYYMVLQEAYFHLIQHHLNLPKGISEHLAFDREISVHNAIFKLKGNDASIISENIEHWNTNVADLLFLTK